jgi:type I restriction enzyme, S subunit
LVLIPPMDIQLRFDAVVAPMRFRMESNERESLTLAALRDTLLPKLLSGEVRVNKAEQLVAAVAQKAH